MAPLNKGDRLAQIGGVQSVYPFSPFLTPPNFGKHRVFVGSNRIHTVWISRPCVCTKIGVWDNAMQAYPPCLGHFLFLKVESRSVIYSFVDNLVLDPLYIVSLSSFVVIFRQTGMGRQRGVDRQRWADRKTDGDR